MAAKSDNIIEVKSFDFAVRIVNLYWMKRIILTEQEIEVVQQKLKDEIDIWSEPEKPTIVCDVIKRAEALM